MLVILPIKLLIWALRKLTKHSATALPGLIIERYFPFLIPFLFSQLKNVILVTGTNGKTTTVKMLCFLLEQKGTHVISNTSGSNLLRGVISTLVDNMTWSGKLLVTNAVFESEEGSLSKIVKYVKPKKIIVTNIFRDQLDAYGEIDNTLRHIKKGIIEAANPQLILNADDERVISLAELSTGKVSIVSLEEKHLQHFKLENRQQSTTVKLSSFEEYDIRNIRIDDNLNTAFELYTNEKLVGKEQLKVPGLHNTYNAAFALIASETNDLGSLSNFEPAFGRGESIAINLTEFKILLGKNPAGINLNLHLLEHAKDREAVLLMLNDNTADGKDVSWIWDCDYQVLKDSGFKSISVTGNRKYDMALRLKYEGVENFEIFETTKEALTRLTSAKHSKVFVIPTYTAMLEFRQEASTLAEVNKIWKKY